MSRYRVRLDAPVERISSGEVVNLTLQRLGTRLTPSARHAVTLCGGTVEGPDTWDVHEAPDTILLPNWAFLLLWEMAPWLQKAGTAEGIVLPYHMQALAKTLQDALPGAVWYVSFDWSGQVAFSADLVDLWVYVRFPNGTGRHTTMLRLPESSSYYAPHWPTRDSIVAWVRYQGYLRQQRYQGLLSAAQKALPPGYEPSATETDPPDSHEDLP